MEVPTMEGKFTERSRVNQLGKCRFSPLYTTVHNAVSQESCLWTDCVTSPGISFCGWTLPPRLWSRGGNGVLWMACSERAVQYSFFRS